MKLDNSVAAVVTGSASGLGAGTAEKLASTGVRVTIFDRDETAGMQHADTIGGQYFNVDVSDPENVREGLERARAGFGQERILVNCAGIAYGGKTVSKSGPHDPEDFAKVLSVNLAGSFNCASLSAAGMISLPPLNDDGERGLIINTASVAAFDGQVGQVAYAASKAGVAGMTLPMARDLARDGIRVLSIAPGLFETPMMSSLPDDVQSSLAAQVPFPSRLGLPDEYASLVCHISENTMLNGETIRLDGAIRMAPR